MRLRLLSIGLRSTLLVVTFAAGTSAQERTRTQVVFSDDPNSFEGTYFTAGEDTIYNPNSSSDGICVGGGCGSGPNVIPQNISDGLAEVELQNALAFRDFAQDLFSTGTATSHALEGFSGGSLSDFHGAGVFGMWNAQRRFYSGSNLFPEVVIRRSSDKLQSFSERFANFEFVPGINHMYVTPVPEFNELRDITLNDFIPTIYPSAQNPRNFVSSAEKYYIAGHKEGFKALEAVTQGAIVGYSRLLRANDEQRADLAIGAVNRIGTATAEFSNGVEKIWSQPSVVTVDHSELLKELIPASLVEEFYFLPEPIRTVYADEYFRDDRGREPRIREVRDAWIRINDSRAASHQGIQAKSAAYRLLRYAQENWNAGDGSPSQKAVKDALSFLDIITGSFPISAEVREAYELYTGEDFFTGDQLSDFETSLRVAAIASFGGTRLLPRQAIEQVLGVVRRIRVMARETVEESRALADILADLADDWPNLVNKLRTAARGTKSYNPSMGPANNFTVAAVSRNEMDILGRAWVGADAEHVIDNVNGLEYFVSRDRMRQYRPPEFKAAEGRVRANLQSRTRISI